MPNFETLVTTHFAWGMDVDEVDLTPEDLSFDTAISFFFLSSRYCTQLHSYEFIDESVVDYESDYHKHGLGLSFPSWDKPDILPPPCWLQQRGLGDAGEVDEGDECVVSSSWKRRVWISEMRQLIVVVCVQPDG